MLDGHESQPAVVAQLRMFYNAAHAGVPVEVNVLAIFDHKQLDAYAAASPRGYMG